jgi:prepilin-type N-terminal cleavage/methylation domain-containing protein
MYQAKNGGNRFHRTRGFTLFEFVVVICIIAIVAAALLGRLQNTAEIAEKVAMDNIVNQINTALLLEFANNVIRNTRGKIPGMAQKNPMDWFAQSPSNYLGEFPGTPEGLNPQGNWYYDTAEHFLVYTVRRGEDFQPDSAGVKRVRYRVKILYDREEPKVLVGVILSPVEPYKWF